MATTKIGFIGTDGRSLLAALETSRATSELYPGDFRGVVVRGTPAMAPFAARLNWPVDFIPTAANTADSFAAVLIEAFQDQRLDLALVMPEQLLFHGLVDRADAAGFGDRLIGLDQQGAFVEADKLACKRLCQAAGIPVAPAWVEVDARDYRAVLEVCLNYLHNYGGAVLKFPYSAGGKGARIILNTWEIREVYEGLTADYREDYLGLGGGHRILIPRKINLYIKS
jgi:phosphoribosylamine--glycine ligase